MLQGKVWSVPRAIDDPVITTFGRLLEAFSGMERRLARNLEAEAELPLTWFEVLLRVARSPEERLMMSELSAQLALTTGGVTRLVDRIVEAGYLERVPAAHDRRVIWAVVTPLGHEVVEHAAEVHAAELHAAELHEIFSGFTTKDRANLDTLLDRLRRN
jgi:MarR family transcriptional regulator, 2-MHQ and catechol-resistance regulon repressor